MAEAKVVLDAAADVGEAPVWLGDGRLLWVDITQGEIHIADVTTGTDRLVARLPEMVGAVVPCRSGGFVAATETGFLTIEEDGEWSVLAEVENDVAGNRMNDGKCDPGGRFWAGTMAFDLSPGAGALYCLREDGSVVKQVSQVTLSNGLDWSPDATSMYFIDSASKTVDVFRYDVETGDIRDRRTLLDVSVENDSSIPDGLTVDAEGGLWVAIWGDGRVQRYLPDGRADVSFRVPASQVTSCTFGGPTMQTLFVTSAAYQLDDAHRRREPLAGAIFAVEASVRGMAPSAFTGTHR